jgi:flavin reductase (DIM6/NTAB) family NADH-FMN oxidoreductase RutF/DNA-binding IclR family transcriptional regulator
MAMEPQEVTTMTVTRTGAGTRAIEPDWYRRVLGQYPTGVCVVAADEPGTGPCGMVVGSFTSVSLDPPLIAFYPAKSSTSWPRIQAAGAFCVNILGADQEDVCRTFSAKAGNKFENVPFHPAPQTASPIIDGVVAWIDCDIEAVQDAGDHVLVLGRVRELDLHRPGLPLLFFQGGYGRFSPHSLAAPDASGSLGTPLRHVDLIRPLMEDIAKQLRCRCLAGARTGDHEAIIAASAGYSRDSNDAATLVGQRLPDLPPTGAVFAAWDTPAEQERWLRHGDPATWEHHRGALRLVRERGYSLGLLSPAQREFASALAALAKVPAPAPAEPSSLSDLMPQLDYDPRDLTPETLGLVRQIMAPVFDADGRVALALTIFGYGTPSDGIPRLIDGLVAGAATATRRIGGQPPPAPGA